MKYIDAEKLNAALALHYAEITIPVITDEGGIESYFRRSEIHAIQKIIDSLQQEQPEVDLEKEIHDYWLATGWCHVMELRKFKVIARYFYGLGLLMQERRDSK